MLTILLPFTYGLILLQVMGRSSPDPKPGRPWQSDALVAGCIFGVLLLAITEVLSLLEWLVLPQVSAAWGMAALVCVFRGLRTGGIRRGWSRLAQARFPSRPSELAALIGLTALIALLLAVGLASPPNNVDTMQYHMPRVEQWVQNRSLAHFATSYDSQNARPYWAELAILNLRILWGSDQPASLPQTFSLLGAMIAVSGIVALLGGGSRAQWLGAALAFSIPMAVLQATAPKNDIVSSFWVAAFAFFVVRAARGDHEPDEWTALTLSLGLGMLTKGTVIPFAAPLGLWVAVELARRRGPARAGRELLGLGLVVLLINLPFWLRNFQTYGGPYGSQIPVNIGLGSQSFPGGQASLAEGLTAPGRSEDPALMGGWGTDARVTQAAALLQLPGAALDRLSRILRMLAMHFVSPFGAFNQAYFRLLERFPQMFSAGFVSFLRDAAWNLDMTAGNPVHLVAIGLAVLDPVRRRNQRRDFALIVFVLAGLAGFFLVSFAGCATAIFCLRYQLPYFFLGAPVVAIAVAHRGDRIAAALTAFFVIYAIPYVLLNNMRPVIGLPPWPTRIESVFSTEESVVLFAQSPDLRDEWQEVTSRINASDCKQVGLSTNTRDLEYALWRLLDAPDSGITLRHLRTTPGTAQLVDREFEPCAVICTSCRRMESLTALPLDADYGHIRLYRER